MDMSATHPWDKARQGEEQAGIIPLTVNIIYFDAFLQHYRSRTYALSQREVWLIMSLTESFTSLFIYLCRLICLSPKGHQNSHTQIVAQKCKYVVESDVHQNGHVCESYQSNCWRENMQFVERIQRGKLNPNINAYKNANISHHHLIITRMDMLVREIYLLSPKDLLIQPESQCIVASDVYSMDMHVKVIESKRV